MEGIPKPSQSINDAPKKIPKQLGSSYFQKSKRSKLMPPPQHQFSHQELLKQQDPNLKQYHSQIVQRPPPVPALQTVQNDLDLQQLYYLQFFEEGDLDDDKSQESFEGNSIDKYIR